MLQSALSGLLDLAKGFGKGAANSGLDIAEIVAQSRMVPGVTPENLPGAVVDRGREQVAYANTTQKVGGGLEMLAELALPAVKAGQAIPRTARAAANFQDVMGAARNVPVDTEAPGKVALRIQELAERGGSMPKAVRDFLRRVTDPDKGNLTYEEARDFASNISRLSADEQRRLAPVVRRELGEMRVVLNEAVAQAAQKAGKGAEYKAAMREYAQAMRMRDVSETVVSGVKKTLPYATAGGAAAYLASKLGHLVRGE